MFDDLRCKYPLPVAGANDLSYQTKDLDCSLDNYEIREDGTLWHEEYDVEDHSDPNAEGLMRLCGMMARVNQRWQQVDNFTGEVCFYGSFRPDWSDWIEWSAYFVRGKLKHIELLRRESPQAADAVDPHADASTERPRAPKSSSEASS
jgi:hypothetical protein